MYNAIPLADMRTTVAIARLLQDNNYLTYDFGKWGLGYPGSSGEPLKQGFSFFYGYYCQHPGIIQTLSRGMQEAHTPDALAGW